MNRYLLAFTVLLAVFAIRANAQSLDCGSAVTLNGPVIEVASGPGDDTENIQCALDAAASDGYKTVLLTAPEYDIGALEVTGFSGDLVGRSIANTRLVVADGSLSCDIEAPGTALRFNVGSASVRQMTIQVGSPCDNNGRAANVIAFYSNPADCTKRTGFGAVDRVDIVGEGVTGADVVTGVLMDVAPGCDSVSQKLLGTLKVNRSTIRDLEFGVLTSLAGGAQVDINYNTFNQVGLPISIIDAYQSTTILGNTIAFNDTATGYDPASGLGTTGIFIASTADSPSDNGTTIKANKFNDAGDSDQGYAILVGQLDKSVAHALVVSGNTFTGNAANTGGAGLAAIDTPDGLVSGNVFKTFAQAWIDLSSGDPADGFVGAEVSGWAIAANSFASSTATTDIVLGSGTAGNVVAKGQELPVVTDSTGQNDVLESSASASVFLDNAISSGPQRAMELQLNTVRGGEPYRSIAR